MALFIGYAAILCFCIAFIAGGTGSRPEHDKWGRRFGIAGVLLTLVAAVAAVL